MRLALALMPPCPRDTPSYDMALTAAILRREGHQVTVFDVNNDLYHEVYKQRPYWKYKLTDHSTEPAPEIFRLQKERLEFHADRVINSRPDAIIMKLEHPHTTAFNVTQIIKGKSQIPVVATGAYTADKNLLRSWTERMRPDSADRFPYDYLIAGEDDIALPKLLKAMEGGSIAELAKTLPMTGNIIDASAGLNPDNLDDLPFYDFTDYDFMRYADPKMIRFCISRSCTEHCAFCMDWVVGRKFRSMSGDRWFEEYLCQNTRHPGLTHYRHYDRLLNGDLPALDRFAERMIAHFDRPPMAWGGDFIIRDEMTDELISKIARAGCNNFGTGFESGSESVRAAVYKDFVTNTTASRIFASCRKHGMVVSLNILIGLPTETNDDFIETIRFIERNRENVWEVRLTMPTMQIVPGTPLHINPKRWGIEPGQDRDQWVSMGGLNNYPERVRRLSVFGARLLEMGQPRLVINRRVVKTAGNLRAIVDECMEAVSSEIR